MRISAIWSLFSSKDVTAKKYENPDFNYLVEFETKDFDVKNRYYKTSNSGISEISKYDIPQPQFSAMLQSEKWTELPSNQ